MSVYDEILTRAQYDVDAGERDMNKILIDAFDYETDNTAQLWELIEDTFSPNELLSMTRNEGEIWDILIEKAFSEVAGDLKQYMDDHVWTVFYCDGPNEGSYWNWDEMYTEEEFRETVDDLVGDGYLLISIYDREAYLEEIEEDE